MDMLIDLSGFLPVHGTTLIDLMLFGLAGAACGGLARYIRYLNRPLSLHPGSGWHYFVGGAAAGLVVFSLAKRFGWAAPEWDWILVAVLGGAVGVGELASRYRDEPIKAILSVPATIYVLLNATASVLALLLGRHFGLWQAPEEPIVWSQVLSAGLGAMVLLRSSVFSVRVGDQDVAVGPSSFLQSVIDAADRAVDRLRAQERAWAVARVMEGVSSQKAITILPSYISALMQNLDKNEQGDFDQRVRNLQDGTQSDQVKALILGLLAMRYTGESVLDAAVQSLDAEIRRVAEETSDAAARAAAAAGGAKAATGGVVVAMQKVVQATQAADSASEVRPSAEEAKEMATVADNAAKAAFEQTQKTVAAAQSTVEQVEQAMQTAGSATGAGPAAEEPTRMAAIGETPATATPDPLQRTTQAASASRLPEVTPVAKVSRRRRSAGAGAERERARVRPFPDPRIAQRTPS